ncbi:MAG: aromatic ring-hydroxylating dioxygenase subunit alpha [Solirubrobacterales bacterium]|nr:aromatic ring-hydroxylating dioxygenase subunit alpha [Solirubrobacterales bacterium]
MNVDIQRELLRRFFALREARTTTLAASPYRQQASVYTDPERLEREERLLLRGRALVVALSADLPGTGDCLACEVAGVPLLLVRGEDAEVRAFLNICRHRGGRVFTGRGRPGRALKCPYHSWAYDLNGDLLGQPLARDAFEPLERTDLGLCPVSAAERFGLILVRLGSPEPVDVAEELAGLGPEVADWGFEHWHFFTQREGRFEANWKLIRDTFLESYHVFSLHRDTLAPDMLSTPFVGDSFGPHHRGVVMRKEVVTLLERPESEWKLKPYGSIVYILFPNAVINLPMSGHAELWEMYPEPGDPHRTRVSVRFYIPREPADEDQRAFWEANVRFTGRVVFEEDFSQQQDIHRSLRTGLMPEVVYGRNEPALIHHHSEMERALASADALA